MQPSMVADIMWSLNGYPYFAFIPDKPAFEGPLFKCLKISSATVALDRTVLGFGLSSSIAKKWSALEWKLVFIAEKLLNRASSQNPQYNHDILPFLRPSHFRYNMAHKHEREARKAISLSKATFVILMARCSFGIAINCLEHEMTSDFPTWACYLIEQGVHFDWVKLLQESPVANFQNYSRKGAIIHIGQCQWLHYVGQMILFSIKIWYYWGTFPQKPFQPLQRFAWIPSPPKEQTILAMIEAKCSSSRNLLQLMPPQSCMQDHSLVPAGDQQEPEVERGSGQKRGETWMAFFDRRVKINAIMMERETLADRERREARERARDNYNPPGKKGAVVYEWEKVDGFWVRKRVNRCDVEDYWHSFSKAQRRYDSFHNEWDMHPEFGPGEKWYDPPSSDEGDELPVVTSTVKFSSAESPNLAGNYSQPEPCPSFMAAARPSSPLSHSSDFLETFDRRRSDCLTASGMQHVVSPSLTGSLLNQPASTAGTHNAEVSSTNRTSCLSHRPTLDEPPAKRARYSSTVSPHPHPTPIAISPLMPNPLISA